MVVYNLEETPNIFITFNYYDKEFMYEMKQFDSESSVKKIREIDLRSDKLVIYGAEITENSYKRLYESLVIRPKAGEICVNCDGACYICLFGKGYSRPIHNVISDWSSFGVVVPNSLADSLRKQLEEKEKSIEESNNQVTIARIEVESLKSSLKASSDENEKLKEQLSCCKKTNDDMDVKFEKASEQIALVDFERELYKSELESCKKDVDELLNDLCTCEEDRQNIDVELRKLQAQLSSVNSELLSTNVELEISTNKIKELDHQLSSLAKGSDEMAMKFNFLESELSLVRSELSSIKDQLKSSNQNVIELQERLSSSENEGRVMEEQLRKMHSHLAASMQGRLCDLNTLLSHEEWESYSSCSLEINHEFEIE